VAARPGGVSGGPATCAAVTVATAHWQQHHRLRQAAPTSMTSEQVQGRAGPEAAAMVAALGSSRVA
jgi:hypothetical protein